MLTNNFYVHYSISKLECFATELEIVEVLANNGTVYNSKFLYDALNKSIETLEKLIKNLESEVEPKWDHYKVYNIILKKNKERMKEIKEFDDELTLRNL